MMPGAAADMAYRSDPSVDGLGHLAGAALATPLGAGAARAAVPGVDSVLQSPSRGEAPVA